MWKGKKSCFAGRREDMGIFPSSSQTLLHHHLEEAIHKQGNQFNINRVDSYYVTQWVHFICLKKFIFLICSYLTAGSLTYSQRIKTISEGCCCHSHRKCLSSLSWQSNSFAVILSYSVCQVPLCTHPFPFNQTCKTTPGISCPDPLTCTQRNSYLHNKQHCVSTVDIQKIKTSFGTGSWWK